MRMKKVNIYTFDTTPDQLKKEGRIYLPHTGYTDQKDWNRHYERDWLEKILEDQRSS